MTRNDYGRLIFDPFTTPEDVKGVRRLPESDLHDVLADNWPERASLRSMCQAELRRREAWASPAGRAFYISMAALLVSIGALIVSALRG